MAALKNLFAKSGYNLPDIMPSDGLLLERSADLIRIGIWIMVPKDDQLMPIVNELLDNIEDKHLNRYKLKDRPKAQIHSWLSLQKSPGTPMGQAITNKYLDSTKETSSKFVEWLDRLFNCPNPGTSKP